MTSRIDWAGIAGKTQGEVERLRAELADRTQERDNNRVEWMAAAEARDAARAEAVASAGARHSRGVVDTLTARVRAALPTPQGHDAQGEPGVDRSDSPHAQPLPQAVRDAGFVGHLSPALPEWMLGLPDGWSHPDGPSLVDAPSRPYLPDLTAELALTAEREHRRSRLRALGNACQVEAAKWIAEAVVRAQFGIATGGAA